MGLDLHPNCIERLTQLALDALKRAVVKDNSYVTYDLWGDLLPLDKVVPISSLKAIPTWENDKTFVSWAAYTLVAAKLYSSRQFEPKAPDRKLHDLEGFEDLPGVAASLIADIDSLPWRYSVLVPIDRSIAETLLQGGTSRILSPSCSIWLPEAEGFGDFPIAPRVETAFDSILGIANSVKNPSYLQIFIEGYISRYGRAETLEAVDDRVKQFVGYGMALELLAFGATTNPKLRAHLHRHIKDSWVEQGALELAQDASILLSGIIERSPEQYPQRVDRLSGILSHPHSSRVALAAQWLAEGVGGSNELLSFVQTMTSLEILLGDKKSSDLAGIGVLLKNRCAYLVGKTAERREYILNQFDKIYDVRSRIVHTGHKRLSAEEREMFLLLRVLVIQAIHEEIKLLVQS